jgi:hypothetical protein
LAIACGSSKSDSSFADDAGGKGTDIGGGNNNGNTGGDGGVLGGGTTTPGGGDGCSDAAKLIYVLSAENDLYSFSPPDKQFKKIGALGCKTSMTPNSMAISRDATAWVNYAAGDPLTGNDTDGAVFKVSTKDASCQPTSLTLDKEWYRLGMGFSSDTAGGSAETLFVAATGSSGPSGGSGSAGLGKVDLKGMALAPIGGFSGTLNGQNAELTGTGDGRLYGFFIPYDPLGGLGGAGKPPQVAQIDKASGATSGAATMTGVEVPSFWAFSFWGGDFYLYTAPDKTLSPQRTTNVTRYSPADGKIDTNYMTNIGFRIVGAGVSTCAPVTAPK